MNKRHLFLLTTIMLLLLAGCAKKSETVILGSKPIPDGKKDPLPTLVPTGVTILADGVVEAAQPALPLRFETGGRLLAVHVQAGDMVKAGDLIATLDDANAQDQVTEAQLSLQLAQLELEALTRGADPAALAAARANLSSARASLTALTRGADPAALAAAQANLSSARASLTALTSPPGDHQLLPAREDLKRAQEALQDLLDHPDPGAELIAGAALTAARMNLRAAQAQLAALLEGSDAETIEQARLNWEQAKNSLWQTQVERDAVHGNENSPGYLKDQMTAAVANAEIAVRLAEISHLQAQESATDDAVAAARASVAAAEAEVTSAQAQYNRAQDSDGEIANARTQVAVAQAALDELLEDADPDELAAAEAQVEQTKAALDALLEDPDPDELAAAEAQVEQTKAALDDLLVGASARDLDVAEINVAQARLALEGAQRGLEEVELVAPASGTVTAVQTAPGTLVGSGSPIVTLLDMAQLEFHTTNLSERDVARVFPGQTALVTLKAFPNEPIETTVARIGVEAGVAAADAATFPVILALSETDLELRPGMTGRVEIRGKE